MKEEKQSENKLFIWLKKIGIVGFLFFLVKGIIWLLIFYGAFNYVSCS